MKPTWGVEVKRYFIESKEVNKKGNAISFPMTVRKLHIWGDFIQTDRFQITLVKRKGEQTFCVKYLAYNLKPKWPSDLLDKVKERKWVKEGSYTKEQLAKWLLPYLKELTQGAIVELLTAPPENIAA